MPEMMGTVFGRTQSFPFTLDNGDLKSLIALAHTGNHPGRHG
jgi:hypothetical protein